MSEPVKKPEDSSPRYEASEVSAARLFAFAAGVVGLILLGVLGSAFVFHFFVQHQPLGPPASPFDDTRMLPPEPRLQTAAPLDLKRYRDEQEKILQSYGWVDAHAGVVRIPIDRAMAVLLQKGLPVRGGAPPKDASAGIPRQAAPAPDPAALSGGEGVR